MLGKKELAVILVILICVCVYFYYEYLSNQLSINQHNNDILEGFEISMTKQKKIDEELTDINITIVNLKRTLRNKEKNTKKLLRNTVRENTDLPKVLANIVMQYVSPGT